jgi:hypothetical protein
MVVIPILGLLTVIALEVFITNNYIPRYKSWPVSNCKQNNACRFGLVWFGLVYDGGNFKG